MEYCYQDILNKIQFIEIEDKIEHSDTFGQLFLN